MNPLRVLLLLSLLTVVAGCATAPVAPGCLRLGRSGQFCLLAPAALPPVSASHLVSIRRAGHEDTFLGQLQIDDHALRLAGASLFGTSLFSIEYDGHAITSRPQQTDLHADILVAMLELALADPSVLQSRLHNLTLTVSTGGHSEVRELFEHGHLIARIEKSAAPLAQAHLSIEIPSAKLDVQMTPIAGSTAQP